MKKVPRESASSSYRTKEVTELQKHEGERVMNSTFFATGSRTREGDFAQLHLSRNEIISVTLSNNVPVSDTEKQGYAEGEGTARWH